MITHELTVVAAVGLALSLQSCAKKSVDGDETSAGSEVGAVGAGSGGDSLECCLNSQAILGMNLENVRESSKSWQFVDVFKSSSPFVSIPKSLTLSLDANGWPLSLASNQHAVSYIMDPGGGTSKYPAGQYVLLYEGSGTVNVSGPVTIESKDTGRIVFTPTPGATAKIAVDISATAADDPVHNIRVIMPGFEETYATQIFHPDFLKSLEPFKVIRLLNWTRSNNSSLKEWAERTATTAQTQNASNGVAPEYIAALANRLKSDIWFNVPHLASDDYVRQLAAFLKQNLDGDLRVFVEHSNEIWGEFQQGTWAEEQGVALALADDPFTARIRFHAQRSVSIFRIFREVFADSPTRVVRVLGAGHMNSQSVSEVMTWQNASAEADVVATAPYYGGRLGSDAFVTGSASGYPYAKPIRNMNADEILATLDSESQLADAATKSNAALIAAQGLNYVTYEGGPAIYFPDFPTWANDGVMVDLFQSVCRADGMRDSYLTNMKRWHDSGGGLYMAFNHITIAHADAQGYWNGCWGALESQDQDPSTSPKWLALMDYLEQFPQ